MIFGLAAAGIVGLGLAGSIYLLWPWASSTTTPEAEEVEDPVPVPEILPQPTMDASRPTPAWSWRPFVDRGPGVELSPPVNIAVAGDWVLPLHSLVFRADLQQPWTGRIQGRALHLMPIGDGRVLDLVEAVRVLPVLLMTAETDVLHVEWKEDAGERAVLAPWLLGEAGVREVPARSRVDGVVWFGSVRVEVHADGMVVAQGVREDRLRWAGSVRVAGESCEGPDVGWSPEEWLQLSRVLDELGEQGFSVVDFTEDVLGSVLPSARAGADLEGLAVPAVLNQLGVAHRREGAIEAALGFFEVGLQSAADDDDDNRADLLFNRGYARLHTPEARAPMLKAAIRDLRRAGELRSDDPDPWAQMAVAYEHLGDASAARDAWEQAAARGRSPEHQRAILDRSREPS